MITIFSTPRPFYDEFRSIQINSINSFLSNIGAEVILFDDEDLTTSKLYSNNKNVKVVSDIEYNINNTPKLKSIFEYIKLKARFDIVVHINTDILIGGQFSDNIVKIFDNLGSNNVFVSGRRYNINLKNIKNVNFSNVHDSIDGVPYLHGKSGLDYWAMNRSSIIDIPNFNCGRPGIDSFLCYKSVISGYTTLEATNFIKIYHQNHPYPSKKKLYFSNECIENIDLAGGYKNMMSMRNFKYSIDSFGNPIQSISKKIIYIILKAKLIIIILGIYRSVKNAKFF